MCQPREGESNGFNYPGRIFPYSPKATQENRPHYDVPNLNELEAVLKQKLGGGSSETTKKPEDPCAGKKKQKCKRVKAGKVKLCTFKKKRCKLKPCGGIKKVKSVQRASPLLVFKEREKKMCRCVLITTFK